MFPVEFVAVFMICLQTEIHLASSLLSLDITVKLKAEHKFYMAVGFSFTFVITTVFRAYINWHKCQSHLRHFYDCHTEITDDSEEIVKFQ
jgi:hypothetical protein